MKITLLTGRTFDLQQVVGNDVKIVTSPRAKRLTLRIDAGSRLAVFDLTAALFPANRFRFC